MSREKGDATNDPMTRIRIVADGAIRQEMHGFNAEYLRNPPEDGFVWVDMAFPDDAMLDALKETGDLHPLFMRSVYRAHRQSSVNLVEDSAHIVVHIPVEIDRGVEPGQVEIILLDGVVVTIHGDVMLDDDVLEHWHLTAKSWRSTTSSLLYALLSVSLERFGPIADHLNDRMDELERDTINRARKSTPKREELHELFELTEYVTDLHSMALPLTDVVHALMNNSDWFVDNPGGAWSRSVYDDAVRTSNRLQALRDSGERMFDMVNSLITLQRTEVSKRLTNVATIFLPMSFIGTYFGQNLQYMTDAVSGGDAFLVWGVGVPLAALAVIVVVMWRFGAFR